MSYKASAAEKRAKVNYERIMSDSKTRHPDEFWWIIYFVIRPNFSRINITWKILQRGEIILEQQRHTVPELFSDLHALSKTRGGRPIV